jgi:hypothetical protein
MKTDLELFEEWFIIEYGQTLKNYVSFINRNHLNNYTELDIYKSFSSLTTFQAYKANYHLSSIITLIIEDLKILWKNIRGIVSKQ